MSHTQMHCPHCGMAAIGAHTPYCFLEHAPRIFGGEHANDILTARIVLLLRAWAHAPELKKERAYVCTDCWRTGHNPLEIPANCPYCLGEHVEPLSEFIYDSVLPSRRYTRCVQ